MTENYRGRITWSPEFQLWFGFCHGGMFSAYGDTIEDVIKSLSHQLDVWERDVLPTIIVKYD